MTPLVSVILPLYNRKAFIGRCAASVMSQTFSDWELVIIDDGSTDGPEAVLADLQAKDERIRIIRQPNGGVSSARNAGLTAARGKYIQFLDSDDELLPSALEYAVGEMRRTQADVVAYHYVHDDCVQEPKDVKTDVFESAVEYIQSLDKGNRLCCPWNKLWRRELIGENRFRSDVTWGEDFVFNLEVLRKVHKAVDSTRCLYHVYNNSPLSLNQRYNPNAFADLLAQAKAIDSLLAEKPSAELLQRFSVYLWTCYMQCVKKLCAQSHETYRKKVEILRLWNVHPRVIALRPYARSIKTGSSILLRHQVVLPVPFVQYWADRKSLWMEKLRSFMKHRVFHADRCRNAR